MLCDNLDGMGLGECEREAQEGGVIYIVVQQKLTQYCKAIMLQLKNKFKKKIVRTYNITEKRKLWLSQHKSVFSFLKPCKAGTTLLLTLKMEKKQFRYINITYWVRQTLNSRVKTVKAYPSASKPTLLITAIGNELQILR